MDSLAEAELDDAEDVREQAALAAAEMPGRLNPLVREHGLVQLASLPEPVAVRSWPLGLALASAPTITVDLTATSFQKVVSLMATLRTPFRSTAEYRVETNQFTQDMASIRAQPQVRITQLFRCGHSVFRKSCFVIF